MVIIIKPTYACDLRCRYCYLGHKKPASLKKMDVDFAEDILRQIKKCFLSERKRQLTIIWHGGEPLLWGIQNFKEIFSFMRKELEGYNYKNLIQTNLTLINDDWIDLFIEYAVHLGFSLDGIKEINDSQRIDIKGDGTFDTIMEKVSLCKKRGLNIGCIIVATRKHIGRIPELFNFMCQNDLNFKFNPIFCSGEAVANIDEYGLSPDEYAQMSIELFDLMFNDAAHSIKDSNFVEIASNLITNKTSSCMFGRNCQDNFLAISPYGDIFPCGRFCDKTLLQYSYGNLQQETLSEILTRIKISDTYKRYEYIEKSNCKLCRFFEICHGGCLHDGFLKTGDFTSKTFLCGAYKKIFAHIQERLVETGML